MRSLMNIKRFCLSLTIVFLLSIVVSCQSKKDKNASSEQSNDSMLVFTTPKVLDVGGFIEKRNQMIKNKKFDTMCFLTLSDIADDVEYVLLKTSNGKQEVFIGSAVNIFICKDYIFVQMCFNIIQYDRKGI